MRNAVKIILLTAVVFILSQMNESRNPADDKRTSGRLELVEICRNFPYNKIQHITCILFHYMLLLSYRNFYLV